MSAHPSLRSRQFKLKRNVRKRFERYAKLARNEQFVEGLSLFGLPKEKIVHIKLKIKEKKKEVIQDAGLMVLEEQKKLEKIKKK